MGLLTELVTGGSWDGFLAYNELTGSVPKQLGGLTLMTEFFTLANNKLSSNVPSELAQLTSLTHGFHLENNNFCDDLPDELA